MTAILDRVLNGYRGADTSAMMLEELQKENAKLNANLFRMSAALAQNRLEMNKLRRSVRRAKPSYSWSGLNWTPRDSTQCSVPVYSLPDGKPKRRWQWGNVDGRRRGRWQ